MDAPWRPQGGPGAKFKVSNGYDATTPVWVAAKNGRVEMVRVLHELGADIEAPNGDGKTPVGIAAQKGLVEMVKVLHELGANVETPQNEDGDTPLSLAEKKGRQDVVDLLEAIKEVSPVGRPFIHSRALARLLTSR